MAAITAKRFRSSPDKGRPVVDHWKNIKSQITCVCWKSVCLCRGVTAAMLETAMETAFDGIGRRLDGKGSMIEKANNVTWTSAPSTCLDFLEVGGKLLLELVKVCPTTLVNGCSLGMSAN